MYRIEKKFKFPMGHRLSKHKGACNNIHGHNYVLLLGFKSIELNSDDMIIDFSVLKHEINLFLDVYDHSCMVNEEDWMRSSLDDLDINIITCNSDPTAEAMSKQIYDAIRIQVLPSLKAKSNNPGLELEYVTLFEDEDSKATYMQHH